MELTQTAPHTVINTVTDMDMDTVTEMDIMVMMRPNLKTDFLNYGNN